MMSSYMLIKVSVICSTVDTNIVIQTSHGTQIPIVKTKEHLVCKIGHTRCSFIKLKEEAMPMKCLLKYRKRQNSPRLARMQRK